MKFTIFKAYLRQYLEKELPDGTEITFRERWLDNQTKVCELVIKEKGNSRVAVIGIDGLYKMYLDGREIEVIIQDALSMVRRAKKHVSTEPIEDLRNWEYVRNHIMYRVVNYDWNKERLSDMPYIRYLDLAIVFFVISGICGDSRICTDVTNELSQSWHVDVRQMQEAAEQNTPREYPVRFGNVGEIFGRVKEICSLLNTEPGERYQIVVKLSDMYDEILDHLYFVSNNAGFCGAALLYPEVLEGILREVGTDYYVIPASTESAIIHPVTEGIDASKLKEVLRSINETTSRPELKLSENIYLYSSDRHELMITA